MQPDHHADDPTTARVGLIRGALVIVTAIAVGAFIMSRAAFDDGASEAVAAGTEESAAGAIVGEGDDEGVDPDPATDPAADGETDPATATTVADAATDPAVDDETTETTAAEATTSTTADPAGPAQTSPAEVQVLVLNAEGTKGVAGRGSEVLRAAGYDVLAPKNATQLASASSILYTDSFDAEALAVAAAFGADIALVTAYDPAAPPINDIGAAKVVVVIGQDGALGV